MLRVLLKKQLTELLSGVVNNRRTGKRRSGGVLAGYVVLLVVIAGIIGVSVGALMWQFGSKLYADGTNYSDVYFTIVGIFSAIIGLIGGMFSTYAILYCPKDNEMLLAMPIPPIKILLSRMLSVVVLLLLYTLPVFLPALLVSFIFFTGFNFLVLIRGLVMYATMILLLLAVSCFLGWLLAIVAAKFGGKKMVSVVSIIVSLGAYYLFYFQRDKILVAVTADPAVSSSFLKKTMYPFYAYGSGFEKDWIGFLIFIAIGAVAFALAAFVLSRSFIKLITMKKGGRMKTYVEKTASVRSSGTALLRREIRRFLGDPLYLINSGLGSIIMIVCAIAALISMKFLREASPMMAYEGRSFVGPAALAALGFASGMTLLSSSSVSLEGNTIWILQTLPVSVSQILNSKLLVHLIFAGTPAAILALCLGIALDLGVLLTAMLIIGAIAAVLLSDCFGLMLETRNPKLNWTDENMAVKQNLNVIFTMLASWGITMVLSGLGVVAVMFLNFPPVAAVGIVSFLLLALAAVFYRASFRFWNRLTEVG